MGVHETVEGVGTAVLIEVEGQTARGEGTLIRVVLADEQVIFE